MVADSYHFDEERDPDPHYGDADPQPCLRVWVVVFTFIVYLLQDCAEFLALLALQMGKLKKGATPDREMAARIGRNMAKFNSIHNLFMDSTLDTLIFGALGRVWWR